MSEKVSLFDATASIWWMRVSKDGQDDFYPPKQRRMTDASGQVYYYFFARNMSEAEIDSHMAALLAGKLEPINAS